MCGEGRWNLEEWRPATAVADEADGPGGRGVPLRLAFREVNEAIRALESSETGELVVVCECDDHRCVAPVSIEVVEFDRLCAEPAQFLVLPGHAAAGAGHVVAAAERYEIVDLEDDAGGAVGQLPLAAERESTTWSRVTSTA